MNSPFDDKIREALGRGDPTESPTSSEANMFQLIGDVVRSKHRWLSAWAFVLSFIIFGLTVFAVVQMFQAPDLRQTIFWAVGALWGSLAVAMLKIWFWMQLDKYSVLREVKRLEAQIARLAELIGRPAAR